jgi:hypothetical protein
MLESSAQLERHTERHLKVASKFSTVAWVVCALIVAVLLANPFPTLQAAQTELSSSDDLHTAWNNTVKLYLERTPSSPGDFYYAGEFMMVPLHAAFERNDSAWEHDFADHFARVAQSPESVTTDRLSRLQYLYLGSEFLVLCNESGHPELIPSSLPRLVYESIDKVWTKEPSWQWDHPSFTGGMRERIEWKLNTRNTPKSFYRAILDEDFFAMAIAADLKAYGRGPDSIKGWSSTLDDVLAEAYKILSQEVVFEPGGGWVFQPGVWRDHADFKYAGNREARAGLKEAPLNKIGWDTSHFLRFPLWLTSFIRAYPSSDPKHAFYEKLRDGLEKQFFDRVLVGPSQDFPGFRTTNYMDGSNGVFRWNYSSLGNNNGYGPYESSGNLSLGWWTFLGTDRVRQMYGALVMQFTQSKEVRQLYVGPTRTRTYSASDLDQNSSANQLKVLIMRLASQLPKEG